MTDLVGRQANTANELQQFACAGRLPWWINSSTYPQRHPCTCEQPNMWTKLWGAKEPNVDREVDPPAAPQGQPRTPSEAPHPEVFGR
jgi:hypothetical protein